MYSNNTNINIYYYTREIILQELLEDRARVQPFPHLSNYLLPTRLFTIVQTRLLLSTHLWMRSYVSDYY